MISFVSVDIKFVTLAAALAEGLMILTTWFLCAYVEHECPALPHLPTISDTWVPAPGNYLSRWITAVVWYEDLSRSLYRSFTHTHNQQYGNGRCSVRDLCD